MSKQLTWSDLVLTDFTPEEASKWLSGWSWLVQGRVAPLFLSRFGDWFLRHPDGSTQMLDVLAGTLTTIATTPDEFSEQIKTKTWQDECLMPELIALLHEKGEIPGPKQCYGVTPHPAMGGKLEPSCIMVMEISAWQVLCAQMLQ